MSPAHPGLNFYIYLGSSFYLGGLISLLESAGLCTANFPVWQAQEITRITFLSTRTEKRFSCDLVIDPSNTQDFFFGGGGGKQGEW